MHLLAAIFMFIALSACKTNEATTGSLESNSSKIYIRKVTCENKTRGVTMIIEPSEHELPFPVFNIRTIFKGKPYRTIEDARIYESTQSSLIVQKKGAFPDRADVEVTAGMGKDGKGFYQEAANDGLSPLPSSEYEKCTAEKIR